jgi:hypothetical protein
MAAEEAALSLARAPRSVSPDHGVERFLWVGSGCGNGVFRVEQRLVLLSLRCHCPDCLLVVCAS